RQHRHTFGQGVLKINQSKELLRHSGPSGFGRILVARDGLADAAAQRDPDGNLLTLTPTGTHGLTHWAIEVKAPSLDVFFRFYHQALGLPRAEEHPSAVAVGDSLIVAGIDPELRAPGSTNALEYLGLRYFTIQVFDVDAIHAQVTALGWQAPMPPTTFGSTARIAFIADPVGNWIELSQRASLTGPLPTD
ncbi:MAG: VOC family protein, partial [Pseudomonadota bacterium]